jgi:hypothetical protein
LVAEEGMRVEVAKLKEKKKQATSGGIVCFVVSFFFPSATSKKFAIKRSFSLRCETPASCSGVLQEETAWS